MTSVTYLDAIVQRPLLLVPVVDEPTRCGSIELVVTTVTLSEFESKRLLATYGVPVVSERLVTTPIEAQAAAEGLGFPVVVKLCGAGLTHKTERRLVRLGISSVDAVRSATSELLGRASPADGEVAVLVASMVRGDREFIAGIVRDPQFGPCVMFGLGGIFAEAFADVAFRVTPLSDVDAEDLISDLNNQVLFGPLRGEPAIDRAALAAIVMGLGRLAMERDDVVAVDINPLIVQAGVPIAVDALVELAV
jgi:acetyl-CoA synthetase (ADP-forming)